MIEADAVLEAGIGQTETRMPDRPGWGAAVIGATEVTLGRPGAWPVALAGLLVRGALVAFVLPIVVLPTLTGLATALGPLVISIALGQPNADVVRLVALAAGLTVAWIVASVLFGALTDALLVRWVADDLSDGDHPAPGGAGGISATATTGLTGVVLRVAVVRATASLPLLIVAAWSATRLVETTRDELVMPGDLAVPLVLRVAGEVPEVFVALAVAWLMGEVVGELATRRVRLAGDPVPRALGRAMTDAVRHLPGVVGVLVLGSLGLMLLVGPALVAATVAWGGVRSVLLGDGSIIAAVPGALALVVTWLGGLVLAGLAATWRSAIWTAEALRHRG